MNLHCYVTVRSLDHWNLYAKVDRKTISMLMDGLKCASRLGRILRGRMHVVQVKVIVETGCRKSMVKPMSRDRHRGKEKRH